MDMADNFKRILLVTHFFPPKHNAGTENYTLGLGKALQAKGYNVQIVCAGDWELGSNYWNGVTTEQFEGLTVYRHHINWVRASDPNRVLYDSPQIEKWFDEFLVDHPFNIAHIIHTYSLGIGVLRSIKRAKIPLVLTLMDFWFLCPSLQLLRSNGELCDGITTAWQCQSCLMANSGLFQRIERLSVSNSIKSRFWGVLAQIPEISRQSGLRGMLLDVNHRKQLINQALSLPDIILTHSDTVQSLFAKSNISVKVIRNGHDLSWLDTGLKASGSDVIRFGYLGQITRIKGVHILVEAFIKADFGTKIELEIWGDYEKDANYTKELLNLIGDHKSIKFQGRYERNNLSPILSDIDVIVVPSLWYENAPLVIQEALAANTPVIATNLGGMAEAVQHEVNGLLFERNDVDALAHQIERLAGEPDLLEKLVKGIPQVKTIGQEIEQLEQIYIELIDGHLKGISI